MANDNPLNHQVSDTPIIPASQSLPEITWKVIILGTILTVILAAANAFLGMKVGQTVSASIPAAIISISILRFFRNSNILENTMVQTMASVSESLIAGVTFILPALIILHAWTHFYYWQTVILALLAGILGVLFTIPLRRALLSDKSLRYPEGTAIANVLRASASKEKSDMGLLSWGGGIGALIALFQTGFQVLTDNIQYWFKTQYTVMGFGLGLSPALIAAGYIAGVNVAISMSLGVVIGWVMGVPILTWAFGMPDLESAKAIAMDAWRSHTRYIGVGTMLVGGIWTLVTLVRPIVRSLAASFASLKETKDGEENTTLRTERDMPSHFVFWGICLMLIPIFLLILYTIMPDDNDVSHSFRALLAGFTAVYVIIGGFLFCSISAYFAGLIGSSNTPVSGLLVSALLILCLILLAFFSLNGGISGRETFAVVLALGSMVIIAGGLAISNDTMQDLKVGQIVGATPWKQQVMLLIGVVVSAFVMQPILELLFNAYGIGGVFPRPGMNEAQMLSAPQAGMMATVAEATYTHHLEWSTIITGGVVAVLCIMVDEFLKPRGMRLPVLAVGLGIYLPLESCMPAIMGGYLSYFIQHRLFSKYGRTGSEKQITYSQHRGLLLACGLVAGASIMGVVLAIPFALKKSSDALKIMPEQYEPYAGVLSVVVTMILCGWIYRVVMKKV